MRYRIDAAGERVITDSLFASPDTIFLVSLAGLNVLLGIGFYVAGRYFRQRWMRYWGPGLSIVSIVYLIAVSLGYE